MRLRSGETSIDVAAYAERLLWDNLAKVIFEYTDVEEVEIRLRVVMCTQMRAGTQKRLEDEVKARFTYYDLKGTLATTKT